MRHTCDLAASGEKRSVRLKAIRWAVSLCFIIIFQPRIFSQETNHSKIARAAPTQNDKSAPYNVTNPKLESGHRPVGSSRTSKTNGPDPNGSEVEAAEQFMRLKAEVYSDLSRLEDSKDSEPMSKPVRVGKSIMPSAGNETADRASGRSITELPVQANPTVEAELYKFMPSSRP